jgi:hypothetical protein
MQKTLISLFSALSIAILGYAVDDQRQEYRSSNQQEDSYERGDDSNGEVAQTGSPSSDPRWYKNRSGRQEYLKGGSDYPYKQSQYNDAEYQNPNAPSSDSRWYKKRSGRQEYLQGGSDYPYKQSQLQHKCIN